MACEAELAAYNSALQLHYQSQINLAAAQANAASAQALVQLTWAAYQQCLAGQGGDVAPCPAPGASRVNGGRRKKR